MSCSWQIRSHTRQHVGRFHQPQSWIARELELDIFIDSRLICWCLCCNCPQKLSNPDMVDFMSNLKATLLCNIGYALGSRSDLFGCSPGSAPQSDPQVAQPQARLAVTPRSFSLFCAAGKGVLHSQLARFFYSTNKITTKRRWILTLLLPFHDKVFCVHYVILPGGGDAASSRLQPLRSAAKRWRLGANLNSLRWRIQTRTHLNISQLRVSHWKVDGLVCPQTIALSSFYFAEMWIYPGKRHRRSCVRANSVPDTCHFQEHQDAKFFYKNKIEARKLSAGWPDNESKENP